MNCKSCSAQIEIENKYCPSCGCIVMNDKLSIKGILQEFLIGPFFSWDSHFWKTIQYLFTKPDRVLNAYISGARKKYFKPFSFLIVLATIALIHNKFFPMTGFADFTGGFEKGISEASGKEFQNHLGFINDFVLNYYNLLIVFSIPLISAISYLIFYRHKNNFAEHIIIQSYTQSIIGYFSIVLQIILLNILGLDENIYIILYVTLALLYSNYAFIKLYKLSIKSVIISNVLFFGLLIITFIVGLILITIYLMSILV